MKIEYKDPRKFEEEILEKEQNHELEKKDIQELQAIDDLMEELERIVRIKTKLLSYVFFSR